MKTSALFADKFRYYPLRLYPQSWLRRWFIKRSGPESGVFSYNPNLAQCQKVLLFLPEQDGALFVLLPLVLEVAAGKTPDSLLIITDERHRHLLRAIGLESYSHFTSPIGMRYGESEFHSVIRRIQSHEWDLCLFFKRHFILTHLFLAKVSAATYRLGIGCEEQFPFLNISLRPANPQSPYSLRTLLYQQFHIDAKETASHALQAAQHKYSTHAEPVHLSSSNVLLLNLEPPIESEPWQPEEIRRLCEAFASKFRLLALVSDPKQLSPYASILESLQIRTAPVPTTSGALFDMLRQYKGVLTLNSPHAHLFINLSPTRVIILDSENESNWAPPAEPQLKRFERKTDPYALAQSVATFMNE